MNSATLRRLGGPSGFSNISQLANLVGHMNPRDVVIHLEVTMFSKM